MGQLDEAIREHLELKRKHGASEEEVHAEEQEALGPVRREAADAPASEVQDLDEPLPAHAGEEQAELPPEAYEPVEPAMEPVDEEPPYADELPEIAEEPLAEEPIAEGEFDQAYEAPDALEAEPAQPRGDTPTQGFEPVEDVAAPPEGDLPPLADDVLPVEDDEDVLEETPDFLQETPEHDRLWFEQKPPRDFDFDE